MGKTMVNIRVRLEYQKILKEISDKSGVPITTLAEIAIKRIAKVDISELTKVRKDMEDAYERALQRLSDDICPVLPVAPKRDKMDDMIDKTMDTITASKSKSKKPVKDLDPVTPVQKTIKETDDDIAKDVIEEMDIEDLLEG